MPTGGASFERHIVLIAVSNGTVKVLYNDNWQSTINGSGALSTTQAVVRSTQYFGKIYFADGSNWKYYDPSDNTVYAWTASAGSLPVDSDTNKPRLIVTWRGRIVLAGLELDPHNFFMSAVGDASDWDYSPLSITPTQAVAGNTAPFGKVQDVITTLIPYTDDVFIFGCDHSIWMLQGDPMAGGQIDLVTDIIGMAWGISWCKDPTGTLYFVSNLCGIYSLIPGQQPMRISQGIEQLVTEMLMEQVIIRLCWDDALQGLHVFVTPFAAPAATEHYFWEQRTGAWWKDVFGNVNHNPMCCLAFDGDLPGDRVTLIGSWDGYVRKFNPDATDDDGTAITSSVVLGPMLTRDMDDVLVKDQQAMLGTSSGTVTYSVLVGDTPEGALVATAAVTGTWAAGRNLQNLIRRAGHAVYVRIDASVQWSFEQLRMRISGQGKVRRRGR